MWKCHFRSPSLLYWIASVVAIQHQFLNLAYGKTAHGHFSIKEKGLHYITNFGCSLGMSRWKARVKLVDPWNSVRAIEKHGPTATPSHLEAQLRSSPSASLTLVLLFDKTWESRPVKRRPTCESMDVPHLHTSISFPLNGNWSEWQTGILQQYMRPRVWYFLLNDCNGRIVKHLAVQLLVKEVAISSLLFEWEFEAYQPDGSHFSYELLGTVKVAFFHTLCYATVLIAMFLYQVREMKSHGRIHQMVQILNGCVMAQLSCSICHLFHLSAYSKNGNGIPLVDCVSEMLSGISQIAISSMMMFIALGFTLDVPLASSRVKSTGIPIVGIVTTIHVGVVWFGRFGADPRYRFHSASGVVGFMLATLKLLLWMGFVYHCRLTRNKETTPEGVKIFLSRFMAAASLYLLAYPLVCAITCFVAPYLQHKFISNAVFIMQLGSMVWLSMTFLRKGTYFKISDLSQSFLPGGYLSSRGMQRLD